MLNMYNYYNDSLISKYSKKKEKTTFLCLPW